MKQNFHEYFFNSDCSYATKCYYLDGVLGLEGFANYEDDDDWLPSEEMQEKIDVTIKHNEQAILASSEWNKGE